MAIKYVFITGGVVSSLGKGLTAASIAMLMESMGRKVAMLKLDPYLNVDPGTMNPFQHGEVYVTDDGAETDLDLGHYYRFTHSALSQNSNATSGQIYDTVIKNERKGEYLGKTVQVIPHITDEIKRRILLASEQEKNPDIVFVEIGGTVGDIESLPFLEAIRQFRNERPFECINIHLTYVPYLKAAQEVKTKPTQHSVQMLRQIGILPDIILCRSEDTLSKELKEKIALFCNVPEKAVYDEEDVKNSIYEVPLKLQNQKLDSYICKLLQLPLVDSNLEHWKKMVQVLLNPKKTVQISIVGKYLEHKDAYKSIFEALEHAGIANQAKIEINKIESDKIDKETIHELLNQTDGILIPGGFGKRGWEGKVLTAKYARENKIPYFGICLGMQVMVVEYARNVLNLEDANSTEIDFDCINPVISLLENQITVETLGGTMRLGAYLCTIKEESKAYQAYQKKEVLERHRHRFEVNNQYIDQLEKKGLIFTGKYQSCNLCEIAEIKNHPWMLGAQFHPEFKSRPLNCHPLFSAFIKNILKNKK